MSHDDGQAGEVVYGHVLLAYFWEQGDAGTGVEFAEDWLQLELAVALVQDYLVAGFLAISN